MVESNILIYQAQNGDLCLNDNIIGQDIWLTREQIGFIYNRDSDTIGEHINNIYKEGELEEDKTKDEKKIKRKEGTRMVKRTIEHFSLDMIISVGYRVDSKQATHFRKRATSTLKQHVMQGYTVNPNRLEQIGTDALEKRLAIIKRAMDQKALTDDETKGLLDLIVNYLPGILTIGNFDSKKLAEIGETNEEQYKIDRLEAIVALANLKAKLIASGEATELFAHPKDDGGLDACFGAIYQTSEGIDLYHSVEEKAAMLLYLIIKNHPFTDGNKRSGAFLFIWYLDKNGILLDHNGKEKISQQTLVALALLIATSDAGEKDMMTRLVIALLQ